MAIEHFSEHTINVVNAKQNGYSWFFLAILFVFLFGLSACTIRNIPTKNIVMFNKRGHLVDPTGNLWGGHVYGLPYDEITETDQYFDNIIEALKIEALKQHLPKNEKRKILIFIHGGLNTQKGTIKRATSLVNLTDDSIKEEGYFPIFVNWQSSLISSYFNHLFFIRQGRDLGWTTSWLAPIYLGADVVRGTIRFPVVALPQIYNDVRTLPFLKPYQNEICIAKQLILEYQEPDRRGGEEKEIIQISLGENEISKWQRTSAGVKHGLTFPIKWVLSPLVLDSFGTSSWVIMKRNAHMLFNTEEEFFTGSPQTDQSGGLFNFMKKLSELIKDEPEKWEITLVGHSMGAIVMNELIRSFYKMHFDNIIYMAGATTIRDYQDTIFPYLESRKKNQETNVYHLTLHPIAEIRDKWGERFFWVDPPMRGSLLVWIDNFLAKPETPLDRTVGRFTNLMSAIHNTPGGLKKHINIKAFGAGQDRKEVPQKHGDFNKMRFWDPEFWKPRKKMSEWIKKYQCWNITTLTANG